MDVNEIKEKLEEMVPEIQSAEEGGRVVLLLSEVDVIVGDDN